MMEEIDNHIGRSGSLTGFAYYNECTDNRGIRLVAISENRIDEAASLCDQAQKMCKAHSCFDPQREVRVAVHRLMYEIRKKYGCDSCQGTVPLIELLRDS